MRIQHIYVDPEGETHFKDTEVEYHSVYGGIDNWSEAIPVKSLIFRSTPANQDMDFHNAPRKQFCINLNVGIEITVSDGETRYIGPGEIYLLEDTTGKGHTTRVLGNQICVTATVPLA